MQTRRASIKETGEELSQADWERFDAAVAQVKAEKMKFENLNAELPAKGRADRGRQGEAVEASGA
jgi:hypothetical protein